MGIDRNQEDIFNDNVFDFFIRFDKKTIQNLKAQNNGSFDELKRWINTKQYQCAFSKKNEEDHNLSIGIKELNKSINITLKWQAKTYDYKAIINKKSKRVIQEYQEFENSKYYIFEEVDLIFIDFNAPHHSSEEQEELYKKVCNLEISPKSNIENQKEIWAKWIEAQELILSRNAQPIEISTYDQPIQISETKYQFRVKLKQKENPEYELLQNAIKADPFNIDETFRPDGTILLKLNDIRNGIDRIIDKDFTTTFERDPKIGCILKLKPYLLEDKITELLNNKYKVIQHNNRKTLFVTIQNPSQKAEVIDRLFANGFNLRNFIGRFDVDWDKNIKLDKAFIEEKKIVFGKEEKGKINLPEPRQNTFEKRSKKLQSLYQLYRKLSLLFGKERVRSTILLEFYSNDDSVIFDSDFSESFWSDLKRELYSLDFNADANELEGTISFDFTNQEELNARFNRILNLESKFKLHKSPLETDFKFKVKTNLIARKSQKAEFEDKLKNLAGASFQVETNLKDSKRKNFLTIGTLASQSSDYNNLIFNLPYKWEEDRKQTDRFLDFIEKQPKIQAVIPDLRGEQAKISWLSEAMNKVLNPVNGLDTKPINERLTEFVFDSSKATEVFRDLSEKSEVWSELKKNELLTLNNSQRKAVLSALFADDLALLQGSPGTGKTTVIAEMIWQMVRKKQEQKILLTSETNLAVDNALEKLLNKNHTLVKPIRFGRAAKFEEEGKKYSFERILKWIDRDYKVDDLYENEFNEDEELEAEIVYEDFNNNAVQLWMKRIADNSMQLDSKYSEVMKDWAFELTQPTREMKVLFKDKYFKYCNVIGSTSSSAGSPNFAADYQRIFNGKEFIDTKEEAIEVGQLTKSVKNIIKRYKSDFSGWYKGINVFNEIKNIEFDTVITDEASKATPPELLLPMCYGKKNIIIGDHRQLPPMLHDKSFKEVLETLDSKAAKELAKEIDKDFVETSQFERLISNSDISPTIKSTFNEQYRMHPKINNVIKKFYLEDGGLEPSQIIIENADDTNLNNPFSRHHGFILRDFINPDIHTIWINVDEPEEKSGTSRINRTETEAVQLVLEMLKRSNGFDDYMSHWDALKDENKKREEKEIGIISFYGHQVGLLRDVARYSRNKLQIPIRLNTVDKFQGMERNIIIVSTVRSNKVLDNNNIKDNRDIGFAKSPQRLNVALSRAKRLLIIVGNKDFFSRYKNKKGDRLYNDVIETINEDGLIIDYKELKKKFGDGK